MQTSFLNSGIANGDKWVQPESSFALSSLRPSVEAVKVKWANREDSINEIAQIGGKCTQLWTFRHFCNEGRSRVEPIADEIISMVKNTRYV